MVKKYFLDTEFIEYPNTIQLISIGIVCDDGREYYAVSSEYEFEKADEWVVSNVILPIFNEMVPEDSVNTEHLSTFHKIHGKSIKTISEEVQAFVKEGGTRPEFWGYYCDYDWVVFCWLFGRMLDLPAGYPMYCKDLKQLIDETGKDKLPDPDGEHNALVDAKWNWDLHTYLTQKPSSVLETLIPRIAAIPKKS